MAARYDITGADIENFNQRTWRWKTCNNLQKDANVCLSPGNPPPVPQTGWGFCGTTAEFCDVVPGPPGNGCQSNCALGFPPERLKCDITMTKSIAYYAAWNVQNECMAYGNIFPQDIDVTPWTHLHYAFGTLDSNFNIGVEDPDLLMTFASLKSRKPSLKLIISLGGWNFNDDGTATRTRFSDMASTPENCAKFVASVKTFLNQYHLDGIDLDWEYPTASDRGGKPEDAQNYVNLVNELRSALGNTISVSIAAPASHWYLRGFDIASMAAHVDYITFMTYDLHGNWDWGNKWVGPYLNVHNNWTEIADALNMAMKAGVDSDKLLLGIGFYGRSFKLSDPTCVDPYQLCTYQNPGVQIGDNYQNTADPGSCTKTGGFLAYYEIEDWVLNDDFQYLVYDNLSTSVIMQYNDGSDWIGFDTTRLIVDKMTRATAFCLGGIAAWSVDMDSRYANISLMRVLESVVDDPFNLTPLLNDMTNNFDYSLNDNGTLRESFLDDLTKYVVHQASQNPLLPIDLAKLNLWGVYNMIQKMHEWLSMRMKKERLEDNMDYLNTQAEICSKTISTLPLTREIRTAIWTSTSRHLTNVNMITKDPGTLNLKATVTLGVSRVVTKGDDIKSDKYLNEACFQGAETYLDDMTAVRARTRGKIGDVFKDVASRMSDEGAKAAILSTLAETEAHSINLENDIKGRLHQWRTTGNLPEAAVKAPHPENGMDTSRILGDPHEGVQTRRAIRAAEAEACG
ncbi:hypothetical protein HDU76_006191 [Blyttiomyces sp. JEL0837]|nr:hypothetical protein HDU76_006191 [Blyttiomyces sp. JEL0837]